jgi:hypothetical protein
MPPWWLAPHQTAWRSPRQAAMQPIPAARNGADCSGHGRCPGSLVRRPKSERGDSFQRQMQKSLVRNQEWRPTLQMAWRTFEALDRLTTAVTRFSNDLNNIVAPSQESCRVGDHNITRLRTLLMTEQHVAATVRRLTPCQRLRRIIGRYDAALAIVSAVFLVVSSTAIGAELEDGYSRLTAPPSAPIAGRARAHVQPRASEFAPPYGDPDMSRESAQTVDQLYAEVMRRAQSHCSQASVNDPRSIRC